MTAKAQPAKSRSAASPAAVPAAAVRPPSTRAGETAAARAPSAPEESLWLRELPFSLVLILTILGVAYTSFSKQPIIGYWEILAPIVGLLCIATGWHSANDTAGRLRLIGTQTLHWLGFLLVMNLMLLPTVQKAFTADATGLAIFTLLTLGTFTAGVHVLSWQICVLGLIMALGIPAMAWIENTALIFVLIAAGGWELSQCFGGIGEPSTCNQDIERRSQSEISEIPDERVRRCNVS